MRKSCWALVRRVFMGGLAVAMTCGGAPAQSVTFEGKLRNPDVGEVVVGTGYSLAVDDRVVISGAPETDVRGVRTGLAQIYRRDTLGAYRVEAEVDPMDTSARRFGAAVAISGNLAAVGAPGDTELGDNSGAVYIFTRAAGAWGLAAKIVGEDTAQGDQFGSALAFADGRLLVGAPFHDLRSVDAGAVYVFEGAGSDWTQVQKLESPDDQIQSDMFGSSISAQEGVLVVGSPGDDTRDIDSGAVHVFRWEGEEWNFWQMLQANDGAGGDAFGASVWIDNHVVVVGAPTDNVVAVDSGSAYTFIREGDGWVQWRKVVPNNSAANDRFGSSVWLRGGVLAGGAPGIDTTEADDGKVALFRFINVSWTQFATLSPPWAQRQGGFGQAIAGTADGHLSVGTLNRFDGPFFFRQSDGIDWLPAQNVRDWLATAGYDQLGRSVAAWGDTIVGGAWRDNLRGFGAGAAHVYVRSQHGWQHQAKLTGSISRSEDTFGSAVAIHGDTIVVGAPGQDEIQADTGAVYVFVRENSIWTEQAMLLRSSTSDRNFGKDVAIYGDWLAVSSNGGVVTFFQREDGIWNFNQRVGGITDSGIDMYGDRLLGSGITSGPPLEIFGRLYIWTGSIWTAETRLSNLHPMMVVDVALGERYAVTSGVVGPSSTGKIVAFELVDDSWIRREVAIPDGVDSSDAHAHAVDVFGDRIVTGAFLGDGPETDSGTAYLHLKAESENFETVIPILAPDGRTNDFFGYSVAITQDYVVIGAQLDDDPETNAGSLYVFRLNGDASDASAWILR